MKLYFICLSLLALLATGPASAQGKQQTQECRTWRPPAHPELVLDCMARNQSGQRHYFRIMRNRVSGALVYYVDADESDACLPPPARFNLSALMAPDGRCMVEVTNSRRGAGNNPLEEATPYVMFDTAYDRSLGGYRLYNRLQNRAGDVDPRSFAVCTSIPAEFASVCRNGPFTRPISATAKPETDARPCSNERGRALLIHQYFEHGGARPACESNCAENAQDYALHQVCPNLPPPPAPAPAGGGVTTPPRPAPAVGIAI